MRARERRAPVGFVALVAVLVAGSLIPAAYVVQAAISMGWPALSDLVFRPHVGRLLGNTALLMVFGIPLALMIGIGAAWLVERTDLPFRRFFAVAFAAPLAIPAFVASYGWASAVPSLQGVVGGVLIAVLSYSPLVYLPALAALRGLDPALEDTARSLGMGPWKVFFKVVLPQLRLAVLGGVIVVALHLLAEYGAFAFIRFDTFTTAIITAYGSTFAGPNAAALGVVLTLLCLIVLVIEGAARGRARYARVGSGAAPHAGRLELGRARWVALAFAIGCVVLAVLVPMLSVLRWLTQTDPAVFIDLVSAATQTLVLGTLGAFAAVLVGLPIAWLSVRYPSRAVRLLEGGSYVASSLPAIIIALALVTVTLNLVPAIYQSVATVVIAYVIIFLPRALVPLRAGIAQIPLGLEEAARSLGVAPWRARLRVTLPLLLPSLAAAVSLVALGAANELTATLLLAPTGTRTVATQFWSAASAIDYPGAAPYALLLVVLSIPAVALMFAHATGRRLR